MCAFIRIVLFVTLCALSCSPQTATVAFYSPAFTFKGTAFFPLSTEQPFGGVQGGVLFDGPQRLARVSAGRFVTFHLNAGQHTFSDSGPTGPTNKPLVTNLKDGSRYCIRLFASMEKDDPFRSQIKEIPCPQALSEAEHLKRVGIKRVDKAVRSQFDSATTFPTAIREQH